MELRYLLRDDEGEFYSYVGYNDKIMCIPVIFGCEEYNSYEEALKVKEELKHLGELEIVARCTEISIVDGVGDEDWKNKVIAEKNILSENIERLERYLESDDAKQKELLEEQLGFMSGYRDTLLKRLK